MAKPKSFKTVRAFIEHVGRSEFQEELGHTPQVVSRAITENQMPGHWLLDVRDWCDNKNIKTPEHLFKRKRKSPRPTTQFENSKKRFQDPATGAA